MWSVWNRWLVGDAERDPFTRAVGRISLCRPTGRWLRPPAQRLDGGPGAGGELKVEPGVGIVELVT
jgi:hypothetical protein